MNGKLIPIPSDNLGAVVSALRIRIVMLQSERALAVKRRARALADAIQEDIAALTWAMDNCNERPMVDIGGGH